MDWYRRYHGTCTDPKLAKAARHAGVERYCAIAAWDAVLEYASGAKPRGCIFGLDPEDISFAIGCTDDQAQRLLQAFRALGMLNGERVCAWERRQFQSDSSAERTKRWRDKKSAASPNDDVTSPERRNDVLVTDQIQSQIQTPSSPLRSEDAASAAPPKSDPIKQAFDLGVELMTGAGTPEPKARKLVGQWRRDNGETVTLEVLQACRDQSPSDPVPWLVRAFQARKRDPHFGRDQRLVPASRMAELPG